MTTDGPLEGGTPQVAEDNAAVPEDLLSGPDEIGTSAAAGGVTPVLPGGTPVAVAGTPPVTSGPVTSGLVTSGDIFLSTEKGTPRTSSRSRSKPASVVRRIRTVIAYVLLLAVLGAAGIAALALVRGTWMVTPVLSGSMRPGLAVGGVVISQLVPVDSLAVRDVIVFREPNDPSREIVHRIVRLRKGDAGQLLINTQGDANTVRDPWTLTIRGNYAYKVRWSIPLLGYVAVAFQNHRGIALLVAGFVLLGIAASTVFSPRRRERRHRRRGNRRKRPAHVVAAPRHARSPFDDGTETPLIRDSPRPHDVPVQSTGSSQPW